MTTESGKKQEFLNEFFKYAPENIPNGGDLKILLGGGLPLQVRAGKTMHVWTSFLFDQVSNSSLTRPTRPSIRRTLMPWG
jgi:hypothetical protein